MKIHQISVTAARTVPDPYHNYGNLRPEITIRAEPGEGEDFRACIQELQAIAEGLLNDHIEHLINARTITTDKARMTLMEKRVIDLADIIRADQSLLKKQRKQDKAPLRQPRKEEL